MKLQVWFCNLCEEEFTVTDVPRDTVRCTGGHPHGLMGRLTADHWPLEADYRRTQDVTEPETEQEPWGTVVLDEGQRFGLKDAKKAPEPGTERSRRLGGYGWPESLG